MRLSFLCSSCALRLLSFPICRQYIVCQRVCVLLCAHFNGAGGAQAGTALPSACFWVMIPGASEVVQSLALKETFTYLERKPLARTHLSQYDGYAKALKLAAFPSLTPRHADKTWEISAGHPLGVLPPCSCASAEDRSPVRQ